MSSNDIENQASSSEMPTTHIKNRSVQRVRGLARRYRKVAAWGLLIMLLSGIGYVVYEEKTHVSEADARVKADMVVISSRVDGWLSERVATDGQIIKQGDELARVDARATQIKLEELAAKMEALHVRQERVQIEQAMRNSTRKDAVRSAEERLRLTKVHTAQARREFNSADSLLGQTVSRELWALRQTQLHQAESAERIAVDALSAAKTQRAEVDLLNKEYENLQQESVQVKAQIRERELDRDDRSVRSPIDGVVDEKFVHTGEYVSPGQRLFVLHDPKKVWITADIKETKLQGIKPGQSVAIHVDAYPNRHFSGQVERIGNAATAEFALLPSPNPSGNFTKVTQRVPVRIKIEQPDDNPLRPGMMVEVRIVTR